jgi:phage terminase large subunit-like protein
MVLDNGDYWTLEGFQAEVVEDIFAGFADVWVVIPEGNAKTTLMSGVSLYHTDFTPSANCLVAAASRDQAGILFSQAAGLIHRSPGFDNRFRVFEGYRRIVSHGTQGRIQVMAADERTGDGAIPSLGMVDEPHRMRDLNLYRTWRGKLDKRGGQLVAISTAGEPGGEFEEVRARMHSDATDSRVDGSHTRSASEDSVIHDWRIDPDADHADMEAVKAANPLSTITVETLAKRYRSPSMKPEHWARFVCNVATMAGGAWLPPGRWGELYEENVEIPEGADVVLGVDVGTKSDTSAVTRLWRRDDGKIVVEAEVFTPQGDGTAMEIAIVERAVRANARRYRVKAVVYDKWSFERSAQELRGEGLLMIEQPMSVERMVIASQNLFTAVMEGRFVHNGDPVLAAHVNAGGVKDQGDRGWRLVKGPAKRPIDALIGMALAFSQMSKPPRPKPTFEVIA